MTHISTFVRIGNRFYYPSMPSIFRLLRIMGKLYRKKIIIKIKA